VYTYDINNYEIKEMR